MDFVQNILGKVWTEEEVNTQISGYMQRSFVDIQEKCKTYECDLRTGAYTLGLDRISVAAFTRSGPVPLDHIVDEFLI